MENPMREYSVRGIKKTFKEVTSEDAYLLGYLACDGGFITNRGFPFIMVSSTEKNIIEDFQKEYLPNANIYSVGKKSSKKVNATNDVYELRWPGKASEQFKKFGIFCKKQDRRIVGIPKHHIYEYLAGVIEADGFIAVTHRKDCRTPRLRFFITHGGEKFLADLQNWLPISTTLRQHGENVWRLQAQNTTENMSFLINVLPFMRNYKKRTVLTQYLNKYYEPQESGELLEPYQESAAKPHEAEGSETR